MAMLMLLHTVADFGDFRGQADAMAAFDVQALPAADVLRADAVRLNLPCLDHRFSHDDPALAPLRERLFEALRSGMHLPVDERVMLTKLLVDCHSMRNEYAICSHVLALMQDVVAGASPRWQAWWWQLAAEIHLYTGERALARADLANLQALLPSGLRVQTLLLLRRREYGAALERAELALQPSRDHERPERDFAGYVELRAYALIGLGRHDEAAAVWESQRATQLSGQQDMWEVLIALSRAVKALDTGAADGPALAIEALHRAAAIQYHRYLMSLPDWAARITAIGLEAGIETEFLTRVVRERKMAPPDRSSPNWPWPLHVEAFGTLRVRRDGEPIGGQGGQGGKAQRKPLELLALLAAHPEGVETDRLVDPLWPSLEADAPKASLEMAITRLRKWLGLADAVRVADGRVALHPAIVWTDVAAFEHACNAGDAARALALYRAPLLPTEPLLTERLAARLVAVVLEAAPAMAPRRARCWRARWR